MSSGPLANLRVLDLTQFLAGPYATLIMGDLGAEIIKIESPAGDMTRDLPPYFVDGQSAYYLSANRNKKSVVVDLKSEAGQEIVSSLVAVSDVVIENFRPGVMRRLGLDREQLMSRQPSLVWCSISGFGQDGPYSSFPAYDMIIQALSGGMSMTGEPGRPAVRTGIPLSDLAAGMFAVIGVLAAIAERAQSGKGQYIDISMLDCQLSMLSYQAVYSMLSGLTPDRQGRAHASIPTYRGFETSNGDEIVVTANTERMWRSMAEVLGVGELVDDDRFLTNADRHQNRHDLWALIEPRFLERRADQWLTQFRNVGVPAAVVNTVDAALSDPQVEHREMVVTTRSHGGTPVRLVGNPVRMSRALPQAEYSYPPQLGEHTEDVLKSVLHCSDQDLRRLRDDNVIASTPLAAAGGEGGELSA